MSSPTPLTGSGSRSDVPPPLSRRHLLRQGSRVALALALGGLGLSGCGERPVRDAPIRGLRQMMPNSLIQAFRREYGLRDRPTLLESRSDLYAALAQDGSPQPALTLLGSDWLDRAIGADLLRPFDPEQLPAAWKDLDPRWQQATQRQGQIWGIPWRWGATAIAYHRRRVPDPIQDWADLWRPELRRRLTLPDHPREVISLALQSLGRSANSPLDPQDPDLLNRLGSLHRQVLSYTSTDYQQILRMGASWVAVGWTEDLFELQKSYPLYQVVIPTSGTSLWYDCWVLPRQGEPADWIPAWLGWVLDREHTPRILELSQIASVVPPDPSQNLGRLAGRPDLAPQTLTKGELWDPLTETQSRVLLTLWRQMRQGELI